MKKLYILNLFLLVSAISYAQLAVTTDITNETLTDWIEGTDVLVTNLVVECDSSAYGTFLNSTLDDGLEVVEGILFATAPAIGAVDGTSGQLPNSVTGDIDLEQSISGLPVYDVCRVEFDVQPLYEFLIFNYVFASNEYPEWVDSGFNDVFGFFVSGPGIDGSFSNGAKNFSNVPGTELPVTINSVHANLNSEYYVDNTGGSAAACSYDGLTTNLPGTIEVQPNEIYHVKIAVADASDTVFDTAIFLQKESFMSVPFVGLPELADLDITLFPNPTSEFLNLTGENLLDMTSYEITGIDGKTIQADLIQKENLQIDIAGLANGSYILNLMQKDQIASMIQWTKN